MSIVRFYGFSSPPHPALSYGFSYAFRSLFRRGLDKSYCPPRQSFARGSLWWPIQLLNCVACRYLCRCRSASFLRRPRAAQSGLYLARLYFGVNTAPHSTQRFTSSRLLLISAHRAASSSELAMAKSVRKNAQPQIENLCSKGAWGCGPQQARGAIWIATSIACQSPSYLLYGCLKCGEQVRIYVRFIVLTNFVRDHRS